MLLSINKDIKCALSQILAVLVKNLLMFSLGMGLGFRTVLIGGIASDDSDIMDDELSWLGSVLLLAVVLGSLLSGFITQPLGRKKAMQLVAIPLTISWIIFYFATKIWQHYCALAIMGFFAGIVEGPAVFEMDTINSMDLYYAFVDAARCAGNDKYDVTLRLGSSSSTSAVQQGCSSSRNNTSSASSSSSAPMNVVDNYMKNSEDGTNWSVVEYPRCLTQNNQQPSMQISFGPVGVEYPACFQYINLMSEHSTRFMKKFNTLCRSITFNFVDVPECGNPPRWLENAFKELLTYIIKDAAPSDRVGIPLRNPNFP